MKTKLVLLSMLMASMAVKAQTPVTITGKIVGLKDSCKVSVQEDDAYKEKSLGSVAFVGENFSLDVKAKLPKLVHLSFSMKTDKGKWMRFSSVRMMLDGKSVQMTAPVEALKKDCSNKIIEKSCTVVGGEWQKQYMEYLDYMREAEIRSDSLGYLAARLWFANNGDDNKIAKERKDEDEAKQKVSEMSNNFILLHPDYAISACLVAQKAYEPFTYTIDDFNKYYKAIENNTDTMHLNFINRNRDLILKQAMGAPYYDFEAKAKDNSMVKLSSLMKKGKYTLIDFWASWCGPCRAAIPKVKAMSTKYADKLQVISCSVDEKEEAWRKAEKEENMPWPQLLVPKKIFGSGVAQAYSVYSIPRLVLLDPDNKIVCVSYKPEEINDKLK